MRSGRQLLEAQLRRLLTRLRGPRPRGRAPARADSPTTIIAELKLRSPSRGTFPWHGDVARQIGAYQLGGARMISVVTDQPFFGGSHALFTQVQGLTALPLLQKDFLLAPYQLYQARQLGASAVLLIVAILSQPLLEKLIELCALLQLLPLVEVHDQAELKRAQSAGAQLIGVNNRDLKTFQTSIQHTLDVLPRAREQDVILSESGLHNPADLHQLRAAGVDGFLIGEALMRAQILPRYCTLSGCNLLGLDSTPPLFFDET